MPSLSSLLRLGFLLPLAALVVSDDGGAWTQGEDDLPPWASDNTLQLKLSADSTNYAVIPLTEKLSLGSSNKEKAVSRETAGMDDYGLTPNRALKCPVI